MSKLALAVFATPPLVEEEAGRGIRGAVSEGAVVTLPSSIVVPIKATLLHGNLKALPVLDKGLKELLGPKNIDLEKYEKRLATVGAKLQRYRTA